MSVRSLASDGADGQGRGSGLEGRGLGADPPAALRDGRYCFGDSVSARRRVNRFANCREAPIAVTVLGCPSSVVRMALIAPPSACLRDAKCEGGVSWRASEFFA